MGGTLAMFVYYQMKSESIHALWLTSGCEFETDNLNSTKLLVDLTDGMSQFEFFQIQACEVATIYSQSFAMAQGYIPCVVKVPAKHELIRLQIKFML